MLDFNIYLIAFLVYSSLSLKPIFLIPGFQISPLYATITNPDLYPECPKSLNSALISSKIKKYPKCAAKLIQTHINKKTNEIEHLPGLSIESSPLGEYDSFEPFSKIISKFLDMGYKKNENIFGVGYDWSLFPFGVDKVYSELKRMIEQVFTKQNEKVILLSHDLGAQFLSFFISNYVDRVWSQKYVDSIIFVAPSIGGWPIPDAFMNQKLDPFEQNEELKKSIMMMPSLHALLPNYDVFGDDPIVTKMYGKYNSYNSSTVIEFLKKEEKIDDEAEKIYKLVSKKYLKHAIPEPPVPSLIIYNDAIQTPLKYIIMKNKDASNSHIITALNKSGDGVVSSRGAEYLCKNWKSSKCFNIDQINTEIGGHSSMLSLSNVIDRIVEYIKYDKSTHKDKPKKALFISPGFSASPLYATITDPRKIPMCPSNLKYHQFFNTILDGKNVSKLSGECIAMLTMAFLDEENSKITYSPGLIIESSHFGDYEKLRSVRSIISRAYELNYTHYKDLWSVGYNFMMHPLMSDQVYIQLKSHIEKYYEETGMKSIIAGHSQGTSFMYIFIMHYVSKEWAQKYIDGVIFLAPAFAGWGTYWRLLEGKFSYQMPDNLTEFHTSVSRMPGLHIMLPNEYIFGNKTVIRNFPNKGDMANATFASELLKKMNRMDDTAFKIFKMTEKYRKTPLMEPPVRSLVLYNDNVSTPILYDYDQVNNNVTKVFGPGDRVVSDDGPKFVCSNWSNVKCVNFHNDFDHAKMLHEKQLIDIIFDFIQQKDDLRVGRSSMPIVLESNNYTVNLNVGKEINNGEPEKSKFFLFVNMGILVFTIIVIYVIIGFLCFNCMKYVGDKKKKPHMIMRDDL